MIPHDSFVTPLDFDFCDSLLMLTHAGSLSGTGVVSNDAGEAWSVRANSCSRPECVARATSRTLVLSRSFDGQTIHTTSSDLICPSINPYRTCRQIGTCPCARGNFPSVDPEAKPLPTRPTALRHLQVSRSRHFWSTGSASAQVPLHLDFALKILRGRPSAPTQREPGVASQAATPRYAQLTLSPHTSISSA